MILINKETILQNKIITALCEQGCFAVNHTVGDFYTKYGGRVKIGTPGESDVWGVLPGGRAFFIEVKLPGENPRQNQKDFINAMLRQGAIAGVAHSVEEALWLISSGN
ncbi:MAG: VRR-NUC domain-containing protein [Oscillospiraceae bacterium]|nr:VRR-NUC domain-containing protein [Oscillospiraceae bacterium]